MSSDPRRRQSRHELTPENLQTAIQVTNIPTEWTSETVSSIVAGSGIIVEIIPKIDPRTNKLISITYDYQNNRECEDAYGLLSRIDRLPFNIEKSIPPNYKDRLKSIEEGQTKNRPEIEMNRDSYPWDLNLELPFQMVTNVPIPRKPIPTAQTTATTNTNDMAFPDILSKASQHLPAMTNGSLTTDDTTGISMNLSKIAPLQLIEMISNLKILANQATTTHQQIEDFLNGNNKDITVAVSQALLEMGFIDTNVIRSVISSGYNVNSRTASMSPPVQQQQQQQNVVAEPIPTKEESPQGSNINNNSGAPRQINEAKLQTAPENQREMIRQVLTLTDVQLEQLPDAQRTMVDGLRKEYLM
ncbi:hypothetical protein C6P45_003734 [Maudiozyma exigua]|uniref:Cleavage stimulation factor subunit 2 hinge domain-containing protein n=1 Tax=Maudiozyma exigua TaxID=34358 RepID=A0A9P6WEA4_MAUEX|nr:hypothetical protein C6P45_003734 [Kazachstania exigua]